ncbi:unnamed protein product [Nyctereutes procyonoides]|uniref:(raccoon dog) hypothetical protein n=1 Tax=Nyctereutes procyonoides TaxID=34880 RepID=A0A811XW01_NYCPR|nr:unnamed protein product [Nyctereutes procyonoides]
MRLVQADSRLHTSMYFFLCNLSLADLCFSTNIVPQALVHLLSRKKIISFTCCAVQLLLFLIFGGTQCAFLAVMSYDQYVAICNPLHYPSIMTWRVCVQLAAGSWTSAILVSVVDATFILRLTYRGSNSIAHFFCGAPALLIPASTDTHNSEMPFSSWVMKSSVRRLKAFSTCGSHLMVVILFYGSGIVTYMTPKSSKEERKLVSVFYAMVTPMLNPLIYSLRNKDMKGALRKVATRHFPYRLEICY